MLYEWFQHIEFRYTWVLPLLLILPLLAFYYFRSARWRKASFTVTTTKAFRVKTFKNYFLHLPFWFRLLSIGCLLLALARPQVRDVKTRAIGQGIDIVICLDVSTSMRYPDFTPNRLEAAKGVAIEFVRSRPVDAIGLVVFGGESFTQFPLTTDHAALTEQIASLKSPMLAEGTAIGEGLATAVDRLSVSKSKSKVVILITDGNEQLSDNRLVDPYTATEIARVKGVKVYTIGMGVPTALTSENRTSADATFLDEALLKRIATATDGTYFRATDRQSMESIYDQIDRLEKTDVEIVSRTRFEERFIYFLMASLLFLALDLILRYTFLRTFP